MVISLLKNTFFLTFFICSVTAYAERNPWTLSISERVINRKNVSHIVIETRTDHFRVNLILSDRFPYNYKSVSYPFFIRVPDAKNANQLADRLSSVLETGKNMYIRLNGSEIVKYTLLNN
jgi:hypothetical protein